MTDKVKGPAAYFPSIEKAQRQPVTHWLSMIEGRMPAKHMEIVAWLKTEHGLGHGHTNALAAHALKQPS